MPVVGTAGHVDHGKSTLVRALTGRDPDRWAEEKERGLTIDLGFAWAEIEGHDISFVDVPGHEHFIKNMLAGIEAIDVALIVVAADEGWMPQSEEHLAVLDLLDTRRGMVAITKVDRVDEDLAGLAGLETAEKLEGTSLAGAPIIAVSAKTGTGMAELRAEMARQVEGISADHPGRPRLWVDRSFSVAGAGTVVTGTLLDGSIEVGDQVTIWPGSHRARIRSIQSHERDVGMVQPRRRVALGLSGVERRQVDRGAMIGFQDQWSPSARLAVSIRPARYAEALTDRGAYHLHVGSGAWPIRLRMLDDDQAVITLPEQLPLAMGDRFVLRDTGRRLVVGGGRVLDPDPPVRGREIRLAHRPLLDALDGTADQRATALLGIRGSSPSGTLTAHSGGGHPADAIAVGTRVITRQELSSLAISIGEALERFHRDNPLRPGMPTASLASTIGVPIEMIDAAIASDPGSTIAGALARREHFEVDRGHGDAEWADARERLESSHPAVPRIPELGIERELLHALIREGELVRISDDFVYLPAQVDEIIGRFSEMSDGFTVSDFKDRTGLSRKYAVPFLEWADRTGLTVRMGDTRRFRT